uniref:Uncharacterized protein n=1 Tax=viral metagenome TaxID=1070528 RepID=A0A6C0CJR7_9ZZZZ
MKQINLPHSVWYCKNPEPAGVYMSLQKCNHLPPLRGREIFDIFNGQTLKGCGHTFRDDVWNAYFESLKVNDIISGFYPTRRTVECPLSTTLLKCPDNGCNHTYIFNPNVKITFKFKN